MANYGRPDYSKAGSARDVADELRRALRAASTVSTDVSGAAGNTVGSLTGSSIIAVVQDGRILGTTVDDIGTVIGGGGGLPATSAGSVDFGSGAYSATTTFGDATVTPTSHIAIMVRREDDEGEWDALTFQYFCESGSLTVRCIANPGPVAGIRDFRYVVFPS